MVVDTLEVNSERRKRKWDRSLGQCDLFHFLSAARNFVLQVRRGSDSQGGGGEDRAGLEWKGQRESKAEEREDSRVSEDSSVDS